MKDYLWYAKGIMRFIDTREERGEQGIYWSLRDAAAGRQIYYDEITMYAGASGIIIYLLGLYDVTKDKNYLDKAKEAAKYIIYRQLNEPELKRNFSKYAFSSGWCGAAFALSKLNEISPEEEYVKTIERILTGIVADATDTDRGNGCSWSDYPGIVGDAGTILVVLELASKLGRDDLRTFAIERGRRYLTAGHTAHNGKKVYLGVNPKYFGGGDDYEDPNYPMGTAGIGFLFLRLYEESGDRVFLDAAKEIPEYLELAAVKQKYGILLPHGLPAKPDLFYLGYCHGPAGTVRFFYKLYEITGDEHYRTFAKELIKGLESTGAPEIKSAGYWNTYNICCGTAGILNMYLGLYAAYGDEYYLKKAEECGKVLTDAAQVEDDRVSYRFALDRIAPDKECTPIGLFDGAAGIGAVLLQLYLAKEGRFKATRMIDDPFPDKMHNGDN